MPADHTNTDTFNGWVCKGKGKALVNEDYEVKAFGPDDVDIAVSHCGICASDIHTLDSGWGPTNYPVVVGHEIVGKVVRVGDNVKTHKVGDRVGVGAQSCSCRKCEMCTKQHENYCEDEGGIFTYNSLYPDGHVSQGGYANFARVHQHWAIPVPEHLSSADAAPLFCAGVTTYLPLKKAGCGPGKKVGVVAIGGLGHLGIQWAKAMGADRVYAVSHSDGKKEDAMKLGATDFIATSDYSQVTAHDRSLDILLVTACGSRTNWDHLFTLMKTGGKIMLVGLPDGALTNFYPLRMCLRELSLFGSNIGSPSDIKDMLKLADEKGVRVWQKTRPMSEVNEALDDVRNGKVHYRFVLENPAH